jgi:sn-1 stearoyl-lipid 9-desaturase
VKSTISSNKFDWYTALVVGIFHIIGLGFAVQTFSFANLVAFAILYMVTGLGITLGFHRYFTHNSFEVTNPVVKSVMALSGSLALQGSIIDWVVDHYQHHNHSDKKPDPHSSKEGFWWSHLLWLFYDVKDSDQMAKFRAKLEKDQIMSFFDKYYVFVGIQVLLGAFLLAIGGWEMVVWGVFLRTVAVWHVTWAINSACHMWGYKNFQDTDDDSRNLWWAAILANGEGWHNNHHKYQTSPRHGLQPWEFDVTWKLIQGMQFLGLAKINPRLIPKVPNA